MLVQEALDLAAEKQRRRPPCDCLDCQALQVLAAEVRRPVELTSNDRKALQAWVDHLVDEKQSFSATDPGFELERRGREILERLLGR